MSSTYYENFKDALPDPDHLANRAKRNSKTAGVKYILSCWIDMFGQPKTNRYPISDFVPLCMGKGPQFGRALDLFRTRTGPGRCGPGARYPISIPFNPAPGMRPSPWVFADLWWERQTLQPVPPPGPETHHARVRRARLRYDGRDRARIHYHAMGRQRQPGQKLSTMIRCRVKVSARVARLSVTTLNTHSTRWVFSVS